MSTAQIQNDSTCRDVKSCCENITFAGVQLHLDARRALWWPRHELLAIADIHLEKARFFGAHGSLLPPHDTLDNLHRLAKLIEDYAPKILLCLGDSFHREEQVHTLASPEHTLLADLTRKVPEWHWLIGNHDPLTQIPFAGQIGRQWERDGLIFTHGDDALPDSPTVLGHFHPKDKLSLPGKRLSGPCFAWNQTRLILPAFGTLTGGMEVGRGAIREVLGDHPCIGLIHGDTVGCYRKK